MGKLWLSYGDATKSVEYFLDALKLNPFLWDAFAELCGTGKALYLFVNARLQPQALSLRLKKCSS